MVEFRFCFAILGRVLGEILGRLLTDDREIVGRVPEDSRRIAVHL